MKYKLSVFENLAIIIFIVTSLFAAQSCEQENNKETIVTSKKPEYFNLRPKLEKEYGYTHAVKLEMILKSRGLLA